MSFASYKCCTLWTLRYMNTTWWHSISSLFNLILKLTLRKVVLHRLAHVNTCTNSLRKQQTFCDALTGFLHEKIMMSEKQGPKKIIFTACHSGKLKLAFTSPNVISTSRKSFLVNRIDFTVLLQFEFLKEHHFPVGQAKNIIHEPESKIHYSQVIGHYFLCTLEE